MEEEVKKDTVYNSTETTDKGIQINVTRLLETAKKFLVALFDFREDTDHEATIEAIKADISFKGATAWILIFAVFVASIGLNANSTAVVIGAMLISPLMGPILGIGMSFALNDINTFKKSLMNLGTMIGLSLFASFLFFYSFPLSEDNSELLGRVSPDIRDVLIAFFWWFGFNGCKNEERNSCFCDFWCCNCDSLNATFVHRRLWFGKR